MNGQIESFDFSVNLLRALLWQYNTATEITSLLESKYNWYELAQNEFWDNWVTDVFDLSTANEFGLDVWAVILGFPLQMISPENNKANFGFGSFNKNFNNGTFSETSGQSLVLSLAQRRMLLQFTYFKTFARCTIPAINAMLKYVLADYGSAWILDANDMSYSIYVLNFAPTSELTFVLENYDVLPRPAGVGLKIIVSTTPVFGFGTFNKNFNNGTFSGS